MSAHGSEKNERMRAETINKILEAGLDVFAEYGYYGTTMKKIVEKADISYGLVYYYFPSKESIFLAIVQSALEKSMDTINEGLAIHGTPWEKLKNLSDLFIQRVLTSDSSRYFLIMIQAMTQAKSLPGIMEHLETRNKEIYEKIIPIVIQAQRSGDVMECNPVALTATYLSSVQGLSFLIFGGTGLDKVITSDILINLLRRKGEPKGE